MTAQRHSIAARIGLEACLAHNDTWPGDPVSVLVSALADEAARAALQPLHAHLARQLADAFNAGEGLAVRVTARAVSVRRLGPSDEAPLGWQAYRLSDWPTP